MMNLVPQIRAARGRTRHARWSRTVSLASPCFITILLLILALSGSTARAQPAPAGTAPPVTSAPPPSTAAKPSAAELQKMVEPIALHPDPLIAMILPAAAYPLDIVQAARFVRNTNNIPKVDDQSWEENVKGVAKFPEMIAKMDRGLQWTVDLGQAFIDQPKEVMDAIQELRKKALQAGNLKTTPEQIVTTTNIVVMQTNVTEVVNVTREIIEVVPANPSVIYVPSYPPTIYYPWYPTYVYPAPLVSFGVGFAWGMFWGAAWIGIAGDFGYSGGGNPAAERDDLESIENSFPSFAECGWRTLPGEVQGFGWS